MGVAHGQKHIPSRIQEFKLSNQSLAHFSSTSCQWESLEFSSFHKLAEIRKVSGRPGSLTSSPHCYPWIYKSVSVYVWFEAQCQGQSKSERGCPVVHVKCEHG